MATTTPQKQYSGDNQVQPGRLFQTDRSSVVYRQRFMNTEAHLKFLSCGEYHLPGGSESQALSAPGCELLLYMWKGRAIVEVTGGEYHLAHYDTLYLPLGTAFRLRNPDAEPARLIQTAATAQNVHPVFHSKFSFFPRIVPVV